MSGEAGPLGLNGASDWRQRESDRWLKTTDALRLEIHDLRDLAKGPTGFKLPEKSSQDGVQKQASWRQQLTVVDGVTVTARLTERSKRIP